MPRLPELPEPESIDTVIQRYNANADRMPQTVLLLARCSVQAGYVDPNGALKQLEGEGDLNFVKPNYFYLSLKHGLGGTQIAQIGSDGTRYWVWYEKEVWWGKHEHLGKAEMRDMPIRPDQLIASLGLTRLPANSPDVVGPLFRVSERPMRQSLHPNYLLSYHWRTDGRFEREYGLSRIPPYLADWIVFGDEAGRIGYEATLADPRRVGVEKDVIQGEPPIMPHYITLRMPSKRNYLTMRVNRPRLKPFTRRLRPPESWREFPRPRGCKMIQIDEAYDRPATQRSSGAPTPRASLAPRS